MAGVFGSLGMSSSRGSQKDLPPNQKEGNQIREILLVR